MSSSPAPSLTARRNEAKYCLPPASAAGLVRTVREHLPAHRFTGEGANRLPRARHYVSTVYFDTQSLALYRRALENDENLKIRAREYYDVHPELLELATDAHDLVRHSPVLWVEIKRKTATRTEKRRLGIPKQDVAEFFAQGKVTAAMHGLTTGAEQDVIAELLSLFAELGEPLRASCVVNYRRNAFENTEGTLRVTLDQQLACFAPPPGLFAEPRPMVRERLGAPLFEESAYIVEVKTRGPSPSWLESALVASGAAPSSYSKFVTASRAVHGDARRT